MNGSAGSGSRSQSIFKRFANASSYASSGRCLRAPCCSRSLSWRSAFSRTNVAAAFLAQQVRHHVDDAGRVEHVDGAFAVLGRDFHGCMLPARGRAADQQRRREPTTLHFAGHEDHLVERRCDETRKTDEIRALIDSRLQNPVARAP